MRSWLALQRRSRGVLTSWRLLQTFHVDFLAEAIYEPRDAFVYAASLNQVEVVRRWLVHRSGSALSVSSTLAVLLRGLSLFARIVKKLNINELDKEGSHALYMAAQNESLEVLELLLTSGANVDQQQQDVRSWMLSPFSTSYRLLKV